MRENCFYVLHSSGQLLSHKRKHERKDSERTYQQFKLAQKSMGDASGEYASTATTSSGANFSAAALSTLLSDKSLLTPESLEILQQIHFQNQSILKANDSSGTEDEHALDNGIENAIPTSLIENAMYNAGGVVDDDCLKKICKNKQLNAALLFAKNNFTAADHHQSEPLNLNLRAKEPIQPPAASVTLRSTGLSGNASSNLQQITSIDGLFNRKRGRPPKNRVVEVYQNVSTNSQ